MFRITTFTTVKSVSFNAAISNLTSCHNSITGVSSRDLDTNLCLCLRRKWIFQRNVKIMNYITTKPLTYDVVHEILSFSSTKARQWNGMGGLPWSVRPGLAWDMWAITAHRYSKLHGTDILQGALLLGGKSLMPRQAAHQQWTIRHYPTSLPGCGREKE